MHLPRAPTPRWDNWPQINGAGGIIAEASPVAIEMINLPIDIDLFLLQKKKDLERYWKIQSINSEFYRSTLELWEILIDYIHLVFFETVVVAEPPQSHTIKNMV